MPQGNLLAAVALLLVVPVAILAFAVGRPAKATAWLMLGAMLYLPQNSGFDLPILPDLDKLAIATICCGVGQLVLAAREHRAARLLRGRDWVVLLCLPATQFFTTLFNLDGERPMQLFEAFTGPLSDVITLTGPFLLGRLVFRTADDGVALLKIIVLAALSYLPLIAIELQLGPVVHPALYGYLQHSLEQTMREGGFRPMVCMAHGLALSLFMACAAMAAFVLARLRRHRILGLPVWMIAMGLLVLSPYLKSSAALAYAVVGVAAVLLLKPRHQTTLASFLSVSCWLYMFLRMFGLINIWTITTYLGKFVSPDRLYSLAFRFFNEDALTQHALVRPIFGWGGWGRNFPPGGAVVDGAWVIILGVGGIARLALVFGLFAIPVFVARRRITNAPAEAQPILGGLSLMLSLSVADLLPNGMFNYLQLFLAGALAGLAWGIPDEKKQSWIPLLLAWYARRRLARPRQA